MKVTCEHVHNIKVLPELVDDFIKPDKKIAVSKLFGDDGAYDGNDFSLSGRERNVICKNKK